MIFNFFNLIFTSQYTHNIPSIETMRAYHQETDSSRRFYVCDHFDQGLSDLEEKLCICFCGSYAVNTTHPLSDVDVLLLGEALTTEEQKRILNWLTFLKGIEIIKKKDAQSIFTPDQLADSVRDDEAFRYNSALYYLACRQVWGKKELLGQYLRMKQIHDNERMDCSHLNRGKNRLDQLFRKWKKFWGTKKLLEIDGHGTKGLLEIDKAQFRQYLFDSENRKKVLYRPLEILLLYYVVRLECTPSNPIGNLGYLFDMGYLNRTDYDALTAYFTHFQYFREFIGRDI